MITIIKNKTPDNLISVQETISEELFQKKDNFKWETRHYSTPIKQELKELYNNKCAFCEVELTDKDTDNKFTVEHYRPKNHYFWLGAEWTNLFPTCVKCNNNKGDYFPLLFERNRLRNAPFDDNGKLIKKLCSAENSSLLHEKALFLHPEIDNPEKFFLFDSHGKAHIKAGLTTFEQERARNMIDKFLKRPSIEEKRKKKIISYQKRLTNLLIKAIPILNGTYTKKEITLLFLDFFTDFIAQKEKDAEFSLLGYYMIVDFDKFFLDEIEIKFGGELRKLVKYAYNLYIDKN